MLHAAEIWFCHPVKSINMHLSVAPDFMP
jgi:hypothetical protein